MRLKSISMAAGLAFVLGAGQPTWAQGIVPQHIFTGTPDGADPAQLVWTNGLLYGSTGGGGTMGDGSIYTFDPNALAYATIFSFTNANDVPSSPNNVLVTANMIYGTTRYDGTNNYGMIFAASTNGTGFVP